MARELPPGYDLTADVARLQASIDQKEQAVKELVSMVVAHWEDGQCPGGRACLGGAAYDVAEAMYLNPAGVAHALQGAIGMLARAEYDRRHPDGTVGR